MVTERWSSLIIRVWAVEGEPGAFRVRLLSVGDIAGAYETIAVAADTESVLEGARLWLEHFQATLQGG